MGDPPELLPFPEDWSRALAVVAHPDDLEYGTASAVAKWTDQGKWVGYVLATSGEAGIDGLAPAEAGPLRESEEIASAAVVGVDSVEFLGLADGTLTYGLDLRREIAAAIRRHRPELVLSINFHFSWGGPSVNMADHRVLGEALLDATRDAGNRWVFTDLLDEGLEPWSGGRRGHPRGRGHGGPHRCRARGGLRGVHPLNPADHCSVPSGGVRLHAADGRHRLRPDPPL